MENLDKHSGVMQGSSTIAPVSSHGHSLTQRHDWENVLNSFVTYRWADKNQAVKGEITLIRVRSICKKVCNHVALSVISLPNKAFVFMHAFYFIMAK